MKKLNLAAIVATTLLATSPALASFTLGSGITFGSPKADKTQKSETNKAGVDVGAALSTTQLKTKNGSTTFKGATVTISQDAKQAGLYGEAGLHTWEHGRLYSVDIGWQHPLYTTGNFQVNGKIGAGVAKHYSKGSDEHTDLIKTVAPSVNANYKLNPSLTLFGDLGYKAYIENNNGYICATGVIVDDANYCRTQGGVAERQKTDTFGGLTTKAGIRYSF